MRRDPGPAAVDAALPVIVAFDPGRDVGVAFVSDAGELLRREIVTVEEAAALELPAGATVIVGDCTGSAALSAAPTGDGHDPPRVPASEPHLADTRLLSRDYTSATLVLLPPH